MYKVTLFPFINRRLYSDGIDITRYIEKDGLKKITQTVDSSDFSIERSYNAIRLKLINHNNIFSINSTDSLFRDTRDNSIIRITFGEAEAIAFEGRIADEGTYEDEIKRTIQFRILSFESGFNKIITRNPKTSDEAITARGAIIRLLDNREITPIMAVGNISLGIDFEIDSPEWFSGKTLSQGLNSLMTATNSTLSIDDRVISVSPRQKRRVNNPPVFYGYNDKLRRFPMIFRLKAVNTGVQRVFNSIVINDHETRDLTSINQYGLKELSSLSIPFITSRDTAEAIGQNIIETFHHEREELEVLTLSQDIQSLNLGDIVSIDSPSRKVPISGEKFLALYGMRHRPIIPIENGKIIPKAINWEIYEKNENTKELNCMIKLRRV